MLVSQDATAIALGTSMATVTLRAFPWAIDLQVQVPTFLHFVIFSKDDEVVTLTPIPSARIIIEGKRPVRFQLQLPSHLCRLLSRAVNDGAVEDFVGNHVVARQLERNSFLPTLMQRTIPVKRTN